MSASPESSAGRIVLTPTKTAGKPQLTLKVLAGPEQGQTFRLGKPVTTVGRSNVCDVSLSDPLVSRQHCQILLGMGGVTLKDLGSTNGTFLNGNRVTESPLRAQDVISLGNTRLRFAVEVAADSGGPRTPKLDEIAHRKLLTLYEVGNLVNSVLELKTLLNLIMSMAIKVMQANRGFLLLKGTDGKLAPVATHSLTAKEAQLPYSQTIVDTVLKERVPVLVLDAAHDTRFSHRESLKALPINSVICVPIWERDSILGVIYVDKTEGTALFTEEDMYFLSAFANQSAIAIANARLLDEVRREERLRTSLARYLSPGVVEEFLRQGGVGQTLGGRKRRITVLFSDIRGFTGLAEREPPETVVNLLNEYFGAMMDVIFDHQGTLDKFMGDALMALFGAPLEVRDHAFRCVKSALQMRARLEDLNVKWEKEGRPRVQAGYGINTGEAVVGNIGSEKRMEYTAIGDTVNVSARVEKHSRDGQVLVTEDTYGEVKDRVKARKFSDLRVKGKSEKVTVWEILEILE